MTLHHDNAANRDIAPLSCSIETKCFPPITGMSGVRLITYFLGNIINVNTLQEGSISEQLNTELNISTIYVVLNNTA